MPPKRKPAASQSDEEYQGDPKPQAKKSRQAPSLDASVQPTPQRRAAKIAEKDIKKTASREAGPARGVRGPAAKKEIQGEKADTKPKNSQNEVSLLSDDEGKEHSLQNNITKNVQDPEKPRAGRVAAFSAIFPANNDFPAQLNGDVYIQLGKGVSSSVFRLHSDVLSNNSTWFAKTLQEKVYELDRELAARGMEKHGVAHRYHARLDDPERDIWILLKATFTRYRLLEPAALPIHKLHYGPDKRHAREGSVQIVGANSLQTTAAKTARKMQTPYGGDGSMDIDPPSVDPQQYNDQPPNDLESLKLQSASNIQENITKELQSVKPSDNSVETVVAVLKQGFSKSQSNLMDLKVDNLIPPEEPTNIGQQETEATQQPVLPVATTPMSQKHIVPQSGQSHFGADKKEVKGEATDSQELTEQPLAASQVPDVKSVAGNTNVTNQSGGQNGGRTSSSSLENSLTNKEQKHDDSSTFTSMDEDNMAKLQADITTNEMKRPTFGGTATGALPQEGKFGDAAEDLSKKLGDSGADVVKMEGVIVQEKVVALESYGKGPKEDDPVPIPEKEANMAENEQQAQDQLLSSTPAAAKPQVEQPEVKKLRSKEPVSKEETAPKSQPKKTKDCANVPETFKIEDSQPQKTTSKSNTKKVPAPKKNEMAKRKEEIDLEEAESQGKVNPKANAIKAAPKKSALPKQTTKKAPKSETIIKEEDVDDLNVLASLPPGPPPKVLKLQVNKPSQNDETIKPENEPKEVPPVPQQAHHPKSVEAPQQPSELIIGGFTNLFRVYYDQDIIISADSFDDATNQAELLTHFLTFYGLKSQEKLAKVNRILGEKLRNYGQKLFMAIKKDPPRWLYHSLFIRCGVVFKEALIHMVGMHPSFPWTDIPETCLTPYVLSLIRQKVEKLQMLAARVDIPLHELTVKINGVSVLAPGLPKNTKRDAVRTWHAWHTEQILSACYTRRLSDNNSIALRYRLMGQGGHAYLPVEQEWVKFTEGYINEFDEVQERDFKTALSELKKKAQRIVEPLMRHESQLDRDRVEYFTCTNIEDSELPWVCDEEMRDSDAVGPVE